MNTQKQTIIWFGAALAVIALIFVLVPKEAPAVSGQYDTFAKCLADAGVLMYGERTCSACLAQKNLFGSSFGLVNYVECLDNPKQCIDANIQAYPTWVFPDGQRLIGVQSLEKLSELTSCPLE